MSFTLHQNALFSFHCCTFQGRGSADYFTWFCTPFFYSKICILQCFQKLPMNLSNVMYCCTNREFRCVNVSIIFILPPLLLVPNIFSSGGECFKRQIQIQVQIQIQMQIQMQLRNIARIAKLPFRAKKGFIERKALLKERLY